MKDFHQDLAIDQRARGTITVLDYTKLALKTITVNGNVLVEGVNFTAATSNAATATSIASAIDGLTLVNSAAVGALVTIIADASGTTANSYGLATNAAADCLTLSGATLAGGVAAQYSDVFDMGNVDELKNLEIVQYLTAVAGTSTPTVTSTPQYSMDKVTWFDHTTSFSTGFTVINTPQKLDLDFTALYCRIKHVASGTNCVAAVRTDMLAK